MKGELCLGGLLLLALPAACGSKEAQDGSASATAAATVIVPSGPVIEAADNALLVAPESSAVAAKDPTVAIPAGSLKVGSMPGDLGRDPLLEPALFDAALGAFEIDRSPYPNEIGAPPLLGKSRNQATELCKSRGRRLCTETEWEFACKGPELAPFAGGLLPDPKCADTPAGCASGFGVLGQGTLREWTSSVQKGDDDLKGGAVLRGAPRGAAVSDRRCAKRSLVAEDAELADVGFRCCSGDPNAVELPLPAKGELGFSKVELTADKLAEMLKGAPQLAKLGGEVKYFDEAAAKRDIERRADAGVPNGYGLSTAPLAWKPVRGEELLVATARAGNDSFIAAFHRLADNRFRVASVLVLRNDPGPVVLVFDRSVDSRFEWSTCWNCRGESGKITYRDGGRVVITQE